MYTQTYPEQQNLRDTTLTQHQQQSVRRYTQTAPINTSLKLPKTNQTGRQAGRQLSQIDRSPISKSFADQDSKQYCLYKLVEVCTLTTVVLWLRDVNKAHEEPALKGHVRQKRKVYIFQRS